MGHRSRNAKAYRDIREYSRTLHAWRATTRPPERLPLPFLRFWNRAEAPVFAPFVLRVCEETIASYPSEWIGYECAADAQALLGRAEEAQANYANAVEAARRAGDTATAERITAKTKQAQ